MLGGLFNTPGDLNRPTMTGRSEIAYSSLRYQGGRGLQIGDMVHIRDITFGRGSDKKVKSLAKRIVGLPGHKHYKKGRQAWHQVSVGRVSTISVVPICLMLCPRSQKAIAGFKGTTNLPWETRAMA